MWLNWTTIQHFLLFHINIHFCILPMKLPLNPLYTGVIISLNDLWKSAQRLPSDREDLSMISQWSSSDLHGHHAVLEVLTQSKTISQWSPREVISQWMLNKRSTNTLLTQGVFNDLIDISMISQYLSMNAKFVHPKGEMDERSTHPQGSHTETAFSSHLRDR